MATTKHVVRKTRNEAKVLCAADSAGTVTIELADLALNDETVLSPVASISLIDGAAANTIIVTRNSAPIFACGTGAWGVFDVGDCDLHNTHPLVVNFSGAGALMITLNKVSGYGFVGFNGPTGPQP